MVKELPLLEVDKMIMAKILTCVTLSLVRFKLNCCAWTSLSIVGQHGHILTPSSFLSVSFLLFYSTTLSTTLFPVGKSERESPNITKVGPEYGMHEDYNYWMDCKMRERNKNVFVADRLQSDHNQQTAIFTRQADNGERYGFECNEERDYYPYWHPSPWRDAIVMTDDTRRCGMYAKESQNVVDKGHCAVQNYKCSDHPSCVERRYNHNANQAPFDQPPLPNTRKGCEEWTERYPTMPGIWTETGRRDTFPPKCLRTPYQRINHHGNTDTGVPAGVEWVLPGLDWNEQMLVNQQCVVRIRYNTSSKDFDGWDSTTWPDGMGSNPQKDWIGLGYNISGPLMLNINTAQFFRTFEDRSHVFTLKKRPPEVAFYSAIHNFNVRGKRGNIVQVYPSVEYDFVWSRKHNSGNIYRWDYLHIQWTGSDANNPGNAGNGMRMTDRHNLVETVDPGVNTPKPLWQNEMWERDLFGYRVKANVQTGEIAERKIDVYENSMFDNETTIKRLAYQDQDQIKECDHFLKLKFPNNAQRRANDPMNCATLNRASAYFDAGLVPLTKTGTYHFLSTRNNAFTNRGQKGSITIQENWFLMAVSTAFAVVLGALGFSFFVQMRRFPQYIRDHPNGCCAKSCCGQRIKRQEEKKEQEDAQRKTEFLNKVDKMRLKKENSRTLDDGGKSNDDDNNVLEMKEPTRSCMQKLCSCSCCCCCCCCTGFWKNRSQRIKVMLVIVFFNICFGSYGFFNALVQRPDENRSFYFAKAGGGMLNFNW